MHRLLIVDDESEIVEWLHDAFVEQDVVEVEVYKAFNAKEALRLLERHKFDVVLTDIRMPDITGIQLMDIIDYVYTAIQNQGVRYLLKTENDQKIIETVADAIKEIESGTQMEDIVNEARQQMLKALPLIQNEFMQDLVMGLQDAGEITPDRFMELGIALDAEGPAIPVAARIDGIAHRGAMTRKDNLFFALKSIADRLLPADMARICFAEGQHTLLWLVQPRQESWERELIRLKGSLEEIQDTFRNTLGRTVSFALHTKPSRLASIHERYSVLGRIFTYRIGMDKEMILTEKNLSDMAVGQSSAEDTVFQESYRQLSRMSSLENMLEAGQKDDFMVQLSRTIDGLRKITSRSCAPALEVYYRVSALLLSFINRRGLEDVVAAGMDLHKLTRIDDHGSWEEAVDYLKRLSGSLFEMLFKGDHKRRADIVLRLKQFIDTHLEEDLSLTRLSEMVHLNPSYLSRLYKDVAGKNLSEHILEMRIEKAKSLLAMTSAKVGDISAEIGYDSSQSFSRVFKHVVGVSPLEFREAAAKR
jgi:two-component system response regulator YesN